MNMQLFRKPLTDWERARRDSLLEYRRDTGGMLPPGYSEKELQRLFGRSLFTWAGILLCGALVRLPAVTGLVSKAFTPAPSFGIYLSCLKCYFNGYRRELLDWLISTAFWTIAGVIRFSLLAA